MNDVKRELQDKITFLTARVTYYHSIANPRLYEAKIADYDKEILRIQECKAKLKKEHDEAPAVTQKLTLELLQAHKLLGHSDQVAKVMRMRARLAKAEAEAALQIEADSARKQARA